MNSLKATADKSKSKSLAEAAPATHVAEIIYHDGQLMIPNGMGIPEAIDTLYQRQSYLETEVNIQESFDVFPWDGAHAIDAVLTEKFGWSPSVATPGFFGPTPPKMISVEVAPGIYKEVPWGAFSLPGVQGLLHCASDRKNNRVVFKLVAEVIRKDEATVRDIFERVRNYLKTGSIYRGKAIKLRFRDDKGEPLAMPEPKFMDVSKISTDMVIYSDAVQEQIRVNLFAPIQRVQDCLANDIPVKRGVLLGGTYGTGKTLAAVVASKLAVDAGITYIYVPRADELSDAIEFAKQYQSPACAIFVEDIDRAMHGTRSVKMDDILNIIDGIDTKTANLIVVLTTNDLNAINPAMLRPGRLDAVIEVLPPDAKAVQKLIRLYGGNAIEADTDLSTVGNVLAGNIPAVIAEVVKRAKLAQLSIQDVGTKVTKLTSEALVTAAHSMGPQLALLLKRTAEENAVKVPELETSMVALVRTALNGTKESVGRTENKVNQIAKVVGI
jgi:transitional endoplasmic reticulum ATPase